MYILSICFWFLSGGNIFDTSGLQDCFHYVLDREESNLRQGRVFVKIRGVILPNLFSFFNCGNILDTYGLRDCLHCVLDWEVSDLRQGSVFIKMPILWDICKVSENRLLGQIFTPDLR